MLVTVGIVGPLLTIAINGREYHIQGRLLGQHIDRFEALRISVLSTAANLLPVPGAVLVRGQRLIQGGATVGQVTTVTGGSGIVWIGSTAVAAGIGAASVSSRGLGALIATGGLVATVTGLIWIRRLATATIPAAIALVVTEVALTLVGAARFFFILIGLGIEVSGGQALALTISGALASAAGIFPAGIGIREALTAVVATLVDLPAAVGFTAAAADRLAGLLVLSVVSSLLLAQSWISDRPNGEKVEIDGPDRL